MTEKTILRVPASIADNVEAQNMIVTRDITHLFWHPRFRRTGKTIVPSWQEAYSIGTVPSMPFSMTIYVFQKIIQIVSQQKPTIYFLRPLRQAGIANSRFLRNFQEARRELFEL